MDISSSGAPDRSLLLHSSHARSVSVSTSEREQASARTDLSGSGAVLSQSRELQMSATYTEVSLSLVSVSGDSHQNTFKRFEQLLQDAYARISGGSFSAAEASGSKSKSAVAAYGAIEPLTAEKAAGNILGFIERRLLLDVAEGASLTELESRLNAGLEGFKKGFAEAEEQIKALATITPELQADITDTFDRVMKGIDDLRLRFLEPLLANGAAPNAND